MIRPALLTCLLLTPLARAAAQGQPGKAGVTVEVVATASEYVPLSKTISHPGHAYTNCQGTTNYFGQFHSYGYSDSVSGTAETTTQCSTTFSAPTESTLTTYRKVNYTIAKGGQGLYLLSCTQTWGPTAFARIAGGALAGSGADESTVEARRERAGKWSECPAFAIGTRYILTVRSASDARLEDTSGGKPNKPYKLEYLSSGGLPLPSPRSVSALQTQPVTTPAAVKVHMTSSPSGGEIYIDGKFFGSTPSDITVAAGEHIVKVAVSGKEWSRTIEITGGEISVHAEIAAGN